MQFVRDCDHTFDEKTGVCSTCLHDKRDFGCMTLGLCEKCEKYSCRRCNYVVWCPGCEKVLCDSCVKKEYCPACRRVPYCVDCLKEYDGYCGEWDCQRSYDSETYDSDEDYFIDDEELLCCVMQSIEEFKITSY